MPAEQLPKTQSGSGRPASTQQDLEQIAKKVFQLLLQELEQERDRVGARNRKA